MKIVIGNYADPTDNRNLILNDEVKDYASGSTISKLMVAITSIEGLDTPPYRNGTGNWSGADGGYMSTQLYGAREITIRGVYIDRMSRCDYSSTNTDQFDRIARLYIRSRLPIRVKQLVRIFLDSGMTFFTEGYCTTLNMEYTYAGYGDYQITLFCPDPALYRGAMSGAINSDWNSTALLQHSNAGFLSSWLELESGTGSFAHKGHVDSESDLPDDAEEDDSYTVGEEKPYDIYIYRDGSWEKFGQVQYANMHRDNSMPHSNYNHGYEWATGGRSNPVTYSGDYPGYPQLIVTAKSGEICVNPSFYSTTEKKRFSLGYPDTSVAFFMVVATDDDGRATIVNPLAGGLYSANYTGRNIGMQSVIGTGGAQHVVDGYGCTLDFSMILDPGGSGLWTVDPTSVSVNNSGIGYRIGDILTPLIAGESIFVLRQNQKLVVDMAEHTVMIYSGEEFTKKESCSYYITPGSQWFSLQPNSTNNISFSSTSSDILGLLGGDVQDATIQWRNGYAGI